MYVIRNWKGVLIIWSVVILSFTMSILCQAKGTGDITESDGRASTQFGVYVFSQIILGGEDVIVKEGEKAVLSVYAQDGVMPYTFEWYKRNSDGSLSECIKSDADSYTDSDTDAVENTLTFSEAKRSDAGMYLVRVTDEGRDAAECEIRLTVNKKVINAGSNVTPPLSIDKTTADSVKTGDTTNTLFWIITLAVSILLGITAIILYKKQYK